MDLSTRMLRTIACTLALWLPVTAFAQGREVVIGQVAPFSGAQSVTGKAIHAGIKLYFDKVNATGGVNGARLRLETRDDAQKADQTVAMTRALIGEMSPVALIGTVGTSNIKAVIDDGVLARSGVPLVGAVSGASSVIAGRNVFVTKASYHQEVERLFKNLAGLGITRVGLVFQDDALGQDVIVGAEAAAARHGVTLVSRAGYPRNTLEVGAAVETMLKSDIQVVFVGGTTAASIEFVRQYREQGGIATLYGLSIIDIKQMLTKLGADAARGFAFSVVLPLADQQSVPVNQEYLALRDKSTDPDLSARSIEGFIAAKTLVHALRQINGPITPAAVASSLKAMRAVDLGGYTVDFAQTGRSGSSYVDFAMLGGGGRIVH
jgi:ABC-type branched-subunit amino acid transport system substrate-binding protein